MTKTVLLLIALLICHYLADFCLTTRVMIRAKADGRHLWPIVLHASIHAVLVGLCLLVYGVGWQLLLVLMMTELVSHFTIDVLKAQISIRFPYLSNSRHKPYWIIWIRSITSPNDCGGYLVFSSILKMLRIVFTYQLSYRIRLTSTCWNVTDVESRRNIFFENAFNVFTKLFFM